MTVSLGSIVADVSLDYSKLSAGVEASKTKIDALKSVMGGLTVAGVGAAIDIGVATTKMAGGWQSSMTLLQTGAGEYEKNIGMVSDGLLTMAVQTGTATKDLASSMFMVESAGYRGADALKVERAAAEGAKVGHADLTGVTDVLTTAMHDYHMQSSMAVPVMNSLIAAEKAGKMSMDDLNAALTNVLPVASKAGVSISDVEGALAAMAQAGDRGAGAGTHLSQMFSSLQNPAKKGQTVLKEIGLTTQEISDKMKTDLPGAIDMMYEALAKKFPVGSAAFNAAAAALVGGNKQMKAWNELTGTSFADLTGSAKSTAEAMKSHSDAVAGWDKVQGDFNTKVDQAREAVETLGIKIGTALLPVATTLFNTVTPLVTSFDDWITKSGVLNQITGDLSTGISDISGFISTLTGNVNSCGTTFGQANPFLYDAQTVFGNIKDILPDVGTFLANVGTDVNTNLLPPLESLTTNVANAVTNFSNWLDTSGVAATALQDLSGFISGTTQVLGPLIQGISDVVGWLGGGGAGTNTLVVALSAVATAFVGLKIAETATQFSNMWTNLSGGVGVVGNVADAIKTKLAGAVDTFLSSQAPNFKAALDDMKVKAQGAATAEEEVGIAAEGEMAAGVTAGTAEAEASLATMTTEAEASGTAVKGIGVASLGALGPVAALALAMAGIAKAMHDSGITHDLPTAPSGMRYDGNHQLVVDTVANNAKIAAAYKAMQISASSSVTEMNGTIAHSMDETKVKSYTDVSSFTSDAMTMFSKMGDYGTRQMASLDENTIGYWNEIAGYISSHPIDAAINIDMGKGSAYSKVSSGIQKNFYAEGTPSAPPGWAVVGEKGPELMNLHGGETILPHGTMPSSSSAGGGSYGGGNSHAALLAAAREMGREIANALETRQTLISVDGNVLGAAVVQQMRIGQGIRY